MPEVRVQPRSVYEHHIIIQKSNTKLNWAFSTSKHSIYFGLYCKPANSISSSTTRASIDYNSSSQQGKPDLTHSTKSEENSTEDNGTEEDDGITIRNQKRASIITGSTSAKEGDNTAASSINRRKSVLVTNLLDNKDFMELIPIDQVNSSKETIVGSFTAQESGNYVLIFDNMFSRNTSKLLTFNVTSDEPSKVDEGLDLSSQDSIMSGWLLKWRRKRMQGWAKRWLELSNSGVLFYSVRQGSIKRGSLQILSATISTSPQQRTIHLDSGTTLFHLKALSDESFETWLNCIRAKRNSATSSSSASNTNNVMMMHETNGNGIQSAISLLPDLDIQDDDMDDQRDNNDFTNHLVISKALQNMDAELNILKDFIPKEVSSLLNDTTTSSDLPTPPLTTNSSSSSGSIKLKFPFKRGSSSANLEEQSNVKLPTAIATNATATTTAANLSSIIMIDKLTQSLKSLTEYREKISTAYFENYNNRTAITATNGPGILSHQTSFISYAQSDQFFDAEDIVLSSNDENDNESTNGSIVVDSEDEERRDSSSTATDFTATIPLCSHQQQQQEKPAAEQEEKITVTRRTRLPHPVATGNTSIIGMLRKNIGKDLSTIAMPITLNEPINLLQRLCEELEYSELLDKASVQEQSLDRLMYVTVFAISIYASSQYRIGRKPFNPLMSETYECIRPDKGFKFFAEKVSHVPSIVACHAESRNFEYRQTSCEKAKFWGKSLEFITEGLTHVALKGEHPDYFTYNKPSSWLRNLVVGTRYLEHIGEMKVNDHTTGEYAIVTFKEASGGNGGFFSSSNNPMYRNDVVAKFYSQQGKVVHELNGKWSDKLYQVVGPDQYSVIWRVKPPSIPDYQDYYGMTQYAMEINEITSLEQGKLPITDTRLRPDQTLLEDGKVWEAEGEKIRIELYQRERRKLYEAQNKSWDPLWFELKSDKYAESGESWQCKGGYWEARSTGQWPKEMLQLW